MSNSIKYHMCYEKAIEAIVWLADQKPSIDIYHIAKVLFYADKMHINKYARPIIGDTYVCMEYGTVPSGVRDLITENSWISPDYLKCVADSLKVVRTPYPVLVALRKPKMEYFSKTDIECLQESLEKYSEMSFEELKRLTHEESCWQEADINQPVDYRLLVDADNPCRDEILEQMSQTAPYIQF